MYNPKSCKAMTKGKDDAGGRVFLLLSSLLSRKYDNIVR